MTDKPFQQSTDAPAQPSGVYRQALIHLDTRAGTTAGRIAIDVGMGSSAQGLRAPLRDMERWGWVRRLDDQAPVAWLRTEAGTEALNA